MLKRKEFRSEKAARVVKRSEYRWWRILVIVVLSHAGQGQATAVVTVNDDASGRVAALLIDTYDYHLAAAGQMLGADDIAGRVTSPQIGKLAQRWAKATVARFEYVATQHGRTTTTVYHAMSGREANEVLAVSPSGMSTYYPAAGIERRATVDVLASSRLETPDIGHLADAEIKALRTMERDIATGRLPPGGRVRAWISQTTCDSCLRVASSFEAAYGTSVTLYQLPHTSPDHADAAFNRLVSHRRQGAFRLRQWRRSPWAAWPSVGVSNGCLP